MKKSIYPLLLSLLILSVSSCKKDEDSVPNSPDKMALLQNKNWMVTSLIMNNATDTIDIYQDYWTPCERDNYYRFNADHSFLFDEGATMCRSWDEQTISGQWDYDLPTNKLHFQLVSSATISDHYYFTIQDISENALTLIGKDTVGTEIWTDTWHLIKQ